MTDLEIDTVILTDAGHALRIVATEFENANNNSDDAADAVGEHDLADKVRDFAHIWDDKRRKMLGDIAKLAEASSGTGEAFEQLERDFVDVLTGKTQ